MNIKILQENFLKALTKTSRVVPSHPQLPLLQNIKLIAKKDGLEIIATNMETTETVWLGGKVEKEGEACVAARTLFELIASLPAETVSIITKEEALHISCGAFQATLPTAPSGDFPPTPPMDAKAAGSMDKEILDRALASVLFAAATDEGRPLLTGVKIIAEGDEVRLVATDGYRLSVKRVALAAQKLSGAIITARDLSEVATLLPPTPPALGHTGSKVTRAGTVKKRRRTSMTRSALHALWLRRTRSALPISL